MEDFQDDDDKVLGMSFDEMTDGLDEEEHEQVMDVMDDRSRLLSQDLGITYDEAYNMIVGLYEGGRVCFKKVFVDNVRYITLVTFNDETGKFDTPPLPNGEIE